MPSPACSLRRADLFSLRRRLPADASAGTCTSSLHRGMVLGASASSADGGSALGSLAGAFTPRSHERLFVAGIDRLPVLLKALPVVAVLLGSTSASDEEAIVISPGRPRASRTACGGTAAAPSGPSRRAHRVPLGAFLHSGFASWERERDLEVARCWASCGRADVVILRRIDLSCHGAERGRDPFAVASLGHSGRRFRAVVLALGSALHRRPEWLLRRILAVPACDDARDERHHGGSTPASPRAPPARAARRRAAVLQDVVHKNVPEFPPT